MNDEKAPALTSQPITVDEMRAHIQRVETVFSLLIGILANPMVMTMLPPDAQLEIRKLTTL